MLLIVTILSLLIPKTNIADDKIFLELGCYRAQLDCSNGDSRACELFKKGECLPIALSESDCNTGLKLCDDALKATEQELLGMRNLVNTQEDLIKKLATQRNTAYDRLSEESGVDWVSPVVVTVVFIGGFVLGALITNEVR